MELSYIYIHIIVRARIFGGSKKSLEYNIRVKIDYRIIIFIFYVFAPNKKTIGYL